MTEENNIILTEDDPEGLGLVIPEKLDKYFGEPIEGSLDVKAVLHADPRKLADFTQTVNYISDWFYYVSDHNKENIQKFANKAVEDSKELGDYNDDLCTLIDLFYRLDSFINIVKPIVLAYTDEVEQGIQAKVEQRKQQDAESEQKRREIKEQVRYNSMEQSRSISQAMNEAKRKSEMANRDNKEGEGW